jgi:hypothetical protein
MKKIFSEIDIVFRSEEGISLFNDKFRKISEKLNLNVFSDFNKIESIQNKVFEETKNS